MVKRKPDLQKIVSLKRQKAEQDHYIAQKELDRVGAEAQRLVETLSDLDKTRDDVGSLLLSHQNGHVTKLMRDIDALQSSVSEREVELGSVRNVLRRAFDSEDRLKRMKD
tara:strand:- start:4056 stop:4385 length:330 start_codon:yes stop_codon:yes gene_type:complete